MPRHFNPSIGERLRRIFNYKIGDMPSDEVNDHITPVIQIVPKIDIIRRVSSTATGTAAVFTTPADKDFYLTGAFLGAADDAASDNTNTTMTCFVNNVSRNIIDLPKITLTARADKSYVSFPIPILLTRGTSISITNTFTVGASSKIGIVYGYTEETIASN